jgi:hypothetical protein
VRPVYILDAIDLRSASILAVTDVWSVFVLSFLRRQACVYYSCGVHQAYLYFRCDGIRPVCILDVMEVRIE